MKEKIITELTDQQRRLAERHATNKVGTVSYAVCPCCGSMQWAMTSGEPTDSLVLRMFEEFDTERCQPCNFMQRRNPEIYQWVVDVVLHQISRDHENNGEPKP
jgi:hypothetical protein